VLAIDTATDMLSVALGKDGRTVDHCSLQAGRSQLETLLPEIHKVLERNSMDMNSLEGVVVGTGPGLFSGLRVGIATARGLSQALKIPVKGASTLRAQAMGIGVASSGGMIQLPLIDARRGQVFAQLFRNDDEQTIVPLTGIECLDPGAVGDFILSHSEEKVIAGGNGSVAYADSLNDVESLQVLPEADPANMIDAAFHLDQLDTGSEYRSQDVVDLLPVYVREPDADKTILLKKREKWLK